MPLSLSLSLSKYMDHDLQNSDSKQNQDGQQKERVGHKRAPKKQRW